MKLEERYLRNIGPITPDEQELLRNSRVFIAGCGGIGGFIIEYLARCGVGHIICADADRFEESNLNRQLLAVTDTIGEKKAVCAKNRVHSISPNTNVECKNVRLNEDNLSALIDGCDLVMEALDNVSGRIALQEACTQAVIPLVHGAVSGWCAQAAMIMPGENLYETLYSHEAGSTAGVLSFVAGAAAAMQCSLAVRYLCGHDGLHGLFMFDMENMVFDKFNFSF